MTDVPYRIVVGVDRTGRSADAVRLGEALLGDREGELAVAHVFRPGVSSEQAARQWVESLLQTVTVPASAYVIRDISVGGALHDLALDLRAELIVVGSSHRGRAGRVIMGDAVASVIHGAPCAVAVAPSGWCGTAPIQRISVAYDGTPESRLALTRAEELARATGASIRLVHVVMSPDPDGYRTAVELLDQPLTLLGDRADGEVRLGSPADELTRAASDTDLLVVGSTGRGALRRAFAGSTSSALLRRTQCPLKVVPRPTKAVPVAP